MSEDPRVAAVAKALALGMTYSDGSVPSRFVEDADNAVAAVDAYDREHPDKVPWLAFVEGRTGPEIEGSKRFYLYRVRSETGDGK